MKLIELKKGKWYWSNVLGVFKFGDVNYRPEVDSYDFYYVDGNGDKRVAFFSGEAVESGHIEVRKLTKDELMVENL